MPLPAPVEELLFSCADIKPLLNQVKSFPGFAGIVFLPVENHGVQSLELRGVYFESFVGNLKFFPDNNNPIVVQPTTQNSFPKKFKKLEEIDLIFIERGMFEFLVDYPGTDHIHVSRVVVDYINGKKFQNLKIRSEPDPTLAKVKRQSSEIAYSIGVSCPPNWIPKQRHPYTGYVGTIYYIEGSNLQSLNITKQMLMDLVNGPIDSPGPNE